MPIKSFPFLMLKIKYFRNDTKHALNLIRMKGVERADPQEQRCSLDGGYAKYNIQVVVSGAQLWPRARSRR